MKIGLSLSGGGARGIAHLGMMKALIEEGFSFDRVTGASAGSIAGALYCNDISPDQGLDIIKSINFYKLLKPALNWRGLLKLENAAPLLEAHLPSHFERLKRPLIVAGTDLNKGKVKYFQKGQLILPILASCSIPVIFDPILINKTPYIDGGILDNLPIKPIKKCDFIVGMHCNPIGVNYKMSNWKDLMERSMLMAITAATYQNKKKCDVFLEPPALANFTVFDFKKAQELFDIGYNYVKQDIPIRQIEKLMKTV